MGADLGINEGTFDWAAVADFDDLEGYLAYRDNPEHRAIIAEFIRPIIAERAAVQYESERSGAGAPGRRPPRALT